MDTKHGLLFASYWRYLIPPLFMSLCACGDGGADRKKLDVKRIPVVYTKEYGISLMGLEKLHPFDIKKYERIYAHLKKDGLLKNGVLAPVPIRDQDILLAQSQDFLDSLDNKKDVVRYLEAPALSMLPKRTIRKGVLMPFRYASGGTLLAARQALANGIAINLGGGYHHAGSDAGEGFCVFADMPIAVRVLQKEKKIKRALIIDLDAHQGNGTALCLEDDPTTFTFSIHQGNIYPFPKETSDLDVEVDEGTDDRTYHRVLDKHLAKLFKVARPDLVIYQAGCDVLKGDPLTGMAMTADGIKRRDEKVIRACVEHGVPVVMTLGGGYSKNAWNVQYRSIKNIIQTFAPAE